MTTTLQDREDVSLIQDRRENDVKKFPVYRKKIEKQQKKSSLRDSCGGKRGLLLPCLVVLSIFLGCFGGTFSAIKGLSNDKMNSDISSEPSVNFSDEKRNKNAVNKNDKNGSEGIVSVNQKKMHSIIEDYAADTNLGQAKADWLKNMVCRLSGIMLIISLLIHFKHTY